VHFNKLKKELVYYTTNHKDIKLIKLATVCSETHCRLVLIIPTIKKYPPEINECFSILGDDMLIYEMNMTEYCGFTEYKSPQSHFIYRIQQGIPILAHSQVKQEIDAAVLNIGAIKYVEYIKNAEWYEKD